MTKDVVVHVTSVHQVSDPRIFFECRSLAQAGFNVVLVGPCKRDMIKDDVRIRCIPFSRNRLDRIIRITFLCAMRALREKPAIFHIHDFEMIPWGLFFVAMRKKVIFDVHEDFSTAILARTWIPGWVKGVFRILITLFSKLANRIFYIIIAESYYEKKFPNGIKVLNYARIDSSSDIMAIYRCFPAGDYPRLIYTGVLGRCRGAIHHLEFAKRLPVGARVAMIGFCGEKEIATVLRNFSTEDSRLELDMSESDWIPHEKILAAYRRPWTAGIALFPDTPHYREKELTKFFEYMAAGLPILCSDFPVWRELVERNRLGICVDPEDPGAAAEAALWLHEHPEEARAMGERGRRLVREKFNWESQAEVLIGFYRRLLDRHDGPVVGL